MTSEKFQENFAEVLFLALDEKNFLAAEKLTKDLLDFIKEATGAWAPSL